MCHKQKNKGIDGCGIGKVQQVEKEEYEAFLKWLFGETIQIEQELDISLCSTHQDPNIYYTKEIKQLFETTPMQRLGKILHLGSTILENPNSYYTRLEHSKGAYRRCLEFLTMQYQKPSWKQYIEENRLKGYLVEKLKFMCVHDIGHSMFSHSIEKLVGDEDCNHELIGNKIIHDNEEVKQALNQIQAQEENSNLEGDNSLELFCEGNIDFDRMDYLARDRFYLGEEGMEDILLQLESSCELTTISEKGEKVYVYPREALDTIQQFLELRNQMYQKEYRSKNRKLTDTAVSKFMSEVKKGKIKGAEELNQRVEGILGKPLEEFDMETFLETNDIMCFNQLLKMQQQGNNEIVESVIPDKMSLLQMAICMLDPKNRDRTTYTPEEKEFLRNLKNYLKSQDSSKAKIEDIMISIQEDRIPEEVRQEIYEKTNGIGVYEYQTVYKKYNPKEPIYVQDSDGKVKKMEEIDRIDEIIDLSTKTQEGIYIILPELRENGIEETTIQQIKECMKQKQATWREPEIKTRMQLFQVPVNQKINLTEKVTSFFGEERE